MRETRIVIWDTNREIDRDGKCSGICREYRYRYSDTEIIKGPLRHLNHKYSDIEILRIGILWRYGDIEIKRKRCK